MGLSYDLKAIKDSATVCHVERRIDPVTGKSGPGLNPVTEVLIFATIPVGIGEIKYGNFHEFYNRLRKWELLIGPLLRGRGFITLEEVEQHVGLSTNVFPKESAAEFDRKLLKTALERAERKAPSAAEQLQATVDDDKGTG